MAQDGKQKPEATSDVAVPDLSNLVEQAYHKEQTAAVKRLLEETQREQKAPGTNSASNGDGRKGTEVSPREISRPGDAAQASRLGYLHQTLTNLLPAYEGTNLTPAKQNLKDGLQKEMAEQRFGPATKELYGDYVRWLEQKALPQEIGRQLAYDIPVQSSKDFTVSKDGQVSLGLPTDKAPDDAQLERLDGAYRWLAANIRDSDQKEKALVGTISAQMQEAVRTLGLPRGWLPDGVENANGAIGARKDGPSSDNASEASGAGSDAINKPWLQNSTRLMRSALQVREYVDLLDDLKRSSSSKFPGDMPPGATLTRDDKGHVKTINLDLPQSWRLDTAEDLQKLERLEKWVADKKELLEPIKQQLTQLHFYPELVPSQDDLETKDRGVQFDSNGRINGFIDLRNATDGSTGAQHFNLASSRFNVEQRDGKVVMTQTVQLKDVPVWGYLNSFGATDVGKPAVMTREYKPDDYVVVRKGHEFELVQARNLQSDGLWEGTKRASMMALPLAMDAGMLAAGGAELVASLKRGQAAPLVGLLRGGTRTVVGATGVFNNAGARETEWGANLNLARSAYFVGDVGYHTAKSGLSLLPSAWKLSGRLAAAEASTGVRAVVGETPAGVRALASEAPTGIRAASGLEASVASSEVNAISGRLLASPLVSSEAQAARTAVSGARTKELSTMIDGGALGLISRTGNKLMVGAGLGFTPVIASDLVTQASSLKNDPTRIIERQARRQAKERP